MTNPQAVSSTETETVYNFEVLELDETVEVSGTSYSDVAIIESIVVSSSVNTVTFDGEENVTNFESELINKYFISKSMGTIRTEVYQADVFNPSEVRLVSSIDYFDIEI